MLGRCSLLLAPRSNRDPHYSFTKIASLQRENLVANNEELKYRDISATLSEINKIVNVKWLAEKVRELHEQLKQGKSLMDYIMAISDFSEAFKIAQWNCSRVLTKMGELIDFITSRNVDLLVLSETKLNKNRKLQFPGYSVVRKDGRNFQGGVAIVLRNTIPFQHITLPEMNNLEEVLIAGDFNARHYNWNCHPNNAIGFVPHNHAVANGVIILHPGAPTHFPDNGQIPSTLDIVLVKNIVRLSDIETDSLPSDHIPLTYSLGYGRDLRRRDNKFRVHDYARANWKRFRESLNNEWIMGNYIDTTDKLEQLVNALTNKIASAADKCVSYTTIDLQKNEQLPDEIKNLIRQRKTLRKRFQASLNIRRIYLAVNSHSTKIASDNSAARKDDWDGRYNPCADSQSNSEWLRSVLPHSRNILWARRYGKLSYFLTNNPANPSESFPFLTNPSKIRKIIKQTPSTKVPGPDTFQNILLENLPRKMIVQLTYVVNSIIKLQHFPTQWKTAMVIPVLEPNKNHPQSSSYRPISLLSTLSKITERIILEHINKHLDVNHILPYQFGFPSEHNTNQQVARLVKDITAGFNNKKHTALVLVDLEKAFDKVCKVLVRMFPSELRNNSQRIVQMHWLTNHLFPLYQVAGPRQPNANEGAQPSYFNEGFLSLQYYISREIIRHHTQNDSIDIPRIVMQRFPYPPWLNDPLQALLQSFVSLVFMLSFVYPCINTVKVITTEKERQLKEVMKIMGLPNWLHWTAWFLKVFILLLVSVILMLILLKVPWFPESNHSVFTLADPTLLFVFLHTSKHFLANTATTVAGLTWFLSFSVWLFLQNRYSTLSLTKKMLICLASNSAMAFGFQMTLMWEGTTEGLGWSNFFTSVSPDDTFTMAHIILMLIIDTFLHLVIALYVEAVFPGDYGVPKVWYFPVTKSFWCHNSNKIENISTALPAWTSWTSPICACDYNVDIPELANLESDVYEKEPTNLKIGIQMNQLTKIFDAKRAVVRSFSINIFKNQITVFVGHNGAGKTTLMSMLTGMITPTTGTAIVNGHDIRTNMPQVRDSLGLCPQHNVLFDELTVAEHLRFFSRLKGLKRNEVNREIDTFIEFLQLEPKRNSRSKTLSGGMKRKLCVAIAMCGRSKIVILDEPTAGMDPAARRALWDMILNQKAGRTILLSTHFMDEADLLGDRIAIMAGGQLQCCGSSFFLKKKYGAGYHLIIDKSQECDVNGVTNILKAHIPNIKVETNIGSELSYILAENQSSVFEKMLRDLENGSRSLGINSYGISLTTMEEVFMKVGADYEQANDGNAKITEGHTTDSKINEATHLSLDTVTATNRGLTTGFMLWYNQLCAMLMKKIRVTQRNWILLVVQNLIAIIFMIVTLAVTRTLNIAVKLPSLMMTLNSFNNPITVITRDNASNPYYLQYLDILKRENRLFYNWAAENIVENMLHDTTKYTARVRMRYIIGASFKDNTITCWFNNEPHHSPAITLQYSMNSILQAHTSDIHYIQFKNHPLPFSLKTRVMRIRIGITAGFQIAFNLAFCMAFITPFYVLFSVRERVNKSKHLQFASGAKVSAFWLANILWDFTTFLLTIACIIVTLACFQEDGFSSPLELGTEDGFVQFYCTPSSGYTKLSLIKVFLGAALFTIVHILAFDGLNLQDVSDGLHWVCSVTPHYSLAVALVNISNINTLITMCKELPKPEMDITPCAINQECCFDDNFFNIETGVGVNLLYMVGTAVLATCVLLSIEYRIFDHVKYAFQDKNVILYEPEHADDSDVLEEKRRIHSGEIRPTNYEVVLKDLTKQYGDLFAVNQVCLGIKSYECFGLLGVNGAGKTTMFRMMTGDTVISYGDAWICNYNLKTHMKEVHQNIGYCPQFDALLNDLTGKETLLMYCLLRGFSYQEGNIIATQLAKDFDFYRHLHKQVKAYSGGNKRKLSAAISLIGNPSSIFLDEPSAGMDPAAKRHLWNTLCKIRDSGKCLVLTSHSMEECEALCTRLAIMVNGIFKCLGSIQHLKNTSLPWSRMFGIMELGKMKIDNLEDYSLAQSSLEQIFLLFTKQQLPTTE
ncbi:hypothetical protein Trydic_g13091 [Trypoxylus dichotomus]